jgi:glutathione S-transferase
MIQKRLKELSTQLQDREYLEGRFTVADLLMTTVLRIPRNTTLVQEVPVPSPLRGTAGVQEGPRRTNGRVCQAHFSGGQAGSSLAFSDYCCF